MSAERQPGRAAPTVTLASGLTAAVVAAVALTLIAGSTLLTVAFTDYEGEALPAVSALVAGDLTRFLELLPAYGGSLIMRAPAALAADAGGGGELAVYRALAVPCLLAGGVLGWGLWRALTQRGKAVAGWVALLVVVANPVLAAALDTGHPEEYLGAVLCAAALVAAIGDRPLLTGVLLGLAGANKPWAVLAVVPALVALRHGRRTMLVAGGVVCAAVLAPALVSGTRALSEAQGVAQGSGTIFQPWHLFWFLGDHDGAVRGLAGVKDGYRTGPGWLATFGHLPVIAVPLLLSLVAWVRGCDRRDALLLLSFCFLLRCVIDPWNISYYHLPFLLALASHEVVARHRAPVAAVAATAAVWGSTLWARDHLGADAQAALYLAWSLPAVAALAVALFAPARAQETVRRLGALTRRGPRGSAGVTVDSVA